MLHPVDQCAPVIDIGQVSDHCVELLDVVVVPRAQSVDVFGAASVGVFRALGIEEKFIDKRIEAKVTPSARIGRINAPSAGPMPASQPGKPPAQLYHLDTDPGETKNLFDQEPEVVERLSLLIERFATEGRSRPSRED